MPTVAKDSDAEDSNQKLGVESSAESDSNAALESHVHDMPPKLHLNAAQSKVSESGSKALADNTEPEQEVPSSTEDMAGKEDKKKVLELMSLNFNSSADVEKAKELICETLAAKEKKATTRKSKKRRLEMLLEMDGSEFGQGKDASKYSLLKTNPITQALKRVRKEPLQSPPIITSPTSLVVSTSGFLSLTTTAASFSGVSPKTLSPSLRSLKSLSSSAVLPTAGMSSSLLGMPSTAAVMAAVSQSLAVASVPALKRVRRGSRRSGSDKDSSEETTSLSEASEAESNKTEEDDGNVKKKSKIRPRKSLPFPELNSSDQLSESNNPTEESDGNSLLNTAEEEPTKLTYSVKNVRGRSGRGRGRAAVDLILQGKSSALELKPSSVSRMKARSRLSLPYITAGKDASASEKTLEEPSSPSDDVSQVIVAKPKINRLSRFGRSVENMKKNSPVSRANQNKGDRANAASQSSDSTIVSNKGNKKAKVSINRKDDSVKTNTSADISTPEAKFVRTPKNATNKKKGVTPLTVPRTKKWLNRQSELSKRSAVANTDTDEVNDVNSPASEATAVDDDDHSSAAKLVKSGRKSRLSVLGAILKQDIQEEPKLRRSRSSTPVNVSSVTEGKLVKNKSTLRESADLQPPHLETSAVNTKLNEKLDSTNLGKDVQMTPSSKLSETEDSARNISEQNEDGSIKFVPDNMAAILDGDEDILARKPGNKRKKKHFRGLKYSFSSAAEKRRKLAREARRAAMGTTSDTDTTMGAYSDKIVIEACDDVNTNKLDDNDETSMKNILIRTDLSGTDPDESAASIKLSLDDSLNDEANVNVIACVDNKDDTNAMQEEIDIKGSNPQGASITTGARENLESKTNSIELSELDESMNLTLKTTSNESLNDSVKLDVVITSTVGSTVDGSTASQTDINVASAEELTVEPAKNDNADHTLTGHLPARDTDLSANQQWGAGITAHSAVEELGSLDDNLRLSHVNQVDSSVRKNDITNIIGDNATVSVNDAVSKADDNTGEPAASSVNVADSTSVDTVTEKTHETLETSKNIVERDMLNTGPDGINENEAGTGITEVVREIVNDVALSLQREIIQTAHSNQSYLQMFSGKSDLSSSVNLTNAHVDSLSLSLNSLKSKPSEVCVAPCLIPRELPSMVSTAASPTKVVCSDFASQNTHLSSLSFTIPDTLLIKNSDAVPSAAPVAAHSVVGKAAPDLNEGSSTSPNLVGGIGSQIIAKLPSCASIATRRKSVGSTSTADMSHESGVAGPSMTKSPSSQPSVDFLRSLSLIRTEDAESVREEAIKKSVNRPKINILSLTAALNKKKKPVKLKRNNDLSKYEEKKLDNDSENPYTFVASPPKESNSVVPLRMRSNSATNNIDSAKPGDGVDGRSGPSMMRTTRRKAFASSRRHQEDSSSSTIRSALLSSSPNPSDDSNNQNALQQAKEDETHSASADDSKNITSSHRGDTAIINDPRMNLVNIDNSALNSATGTGAKNPVLSNGDVGETSSNDASTEPKTRGTSARERSGSRDEEEVNDQVDDTESSSCASHYKRLDSEEASTGEGESAGLLEVPDLKNGVGSVIVDGGVRKSRRIGRQHAPSPTPQPLAIARPVEKHDDKEEHHQQREALADASLAHVLCKCQERLNPQASLPGGPIYCQAIDSFEGRMLGCCNTVKKNMYLRVSGKIPFLLLCDIHRHRLRRHNCCPGCGLFCTQGVFLECRWSEQRHHYHKLCGVAAAEGGPLQCPHCGSAGPPAEVHLDIRLARKPVVYLEQHQERNAASGARMSWSKHHSSLDSQPREGPELDLGEGRVVSPGKLAPSLDRDRLEAAIVSVSGGKPPNIKCTPKSLYWACKHGDLEKVLQVLCGGVDPNARVKDNNNQTGLHMAAIMGNVAIAHVLVMAGAALDLCDSTLCTPLMIAVQKHHNSMVHYLVAAGADLQIKTNEGMTSLHLAAKLGNLTACRHLLDSGRLSRHAINMQDEGGWTPLVWGSENRHINVVKFLLERGANPQLCDVEQNTALHWAALSGCTRICSMLLDRGCSLHSMNAYQDTPLHIAARQSHRDAVLLLLARGARLDCTNTKQQTPLECAQPDTEVFLQLMLNTKLREVMDTKNHRTNTVLSSDIAAGKEQVPIPCINGIDDAELPRNYLYIAENTEAANINIDRSIGSLKWCHCSDGCNSGDCGCAQLNFRCWYDPEGRLLQDFNYIDPPMIFECNRACGCNKLSCNNRVVQHGITAHLQLFRTTSKGWGVRAMKRILKGSYVCEYVGEIITDLEADQRQDDSYLFDLDNRDSETFCLDARNYGNVARFINHLCAPNLTPVKVFLDHQDLAFPRIALYANRDIEAEEELGFDYGEKFWMIKYKQFTCTCGGATCRYSVTTIQDTLNRYHARLQEGAGPSEGRVE